MRLITPLVNLFIGEEIATLKGIQVHTETNQSFDEVFGNIGQDLIVQYDQFTMNFEEMFFRLN